MHILGSFRAFGTCSKAFIKLEGLEELTEEEREEYQELAMDIFVKYSPKVETIIIIMIPNLNFFYMLGFRIVF